MITVTDVEKLAALARIKLDDASKESFVKEVDAILAYVDQIKDAGVTGEPVFSHSAARNVLREDADAIGPGTYTEKILSAVPSREGEYVKVKQIISQD